MIKPWAYCSADNSDNLKWWVNEMEQSMFVIAEVQNYLIIPFAGSVPSEKNRNWPTGFLPLECPVIFICVSISYVFMWAINTRSTYTHYRMVHHPWTFPWDTVYTHLRNFQSGNRVLYDPCPALSSSALLFFLPLCSWELSSASRYFLVL
jgi:hypothetical protein